MGRDHPHAGPSVPWPASPSDVVIDIRSSGGAPKDTSGTPPLWEGPARSLGSSIGSEVPVTGGALAVLEGNSSLSP